MAPALTLLLDSYEELFPGLPNCGPPGPKHTTSAELPSSYGQFAKLPFELREMVWQYLRSHPTDVLSLNTTLRDEILSVFYETNGELEFVVSGQQAGDHKSQVLMRDRCGKYEPLYPAWMSSTSPAGGMFSQIPKFPIHHFPSVKIRVLGSGGDPVKFLRCWNSFMWLMGNLRERYPTFRTRVQFDQSGDARWVNRKGRLCWSLRRQLQARNRDLPFSDNITIFLEYLRHSGLTCSIELSKGIQRGRHRLKVLAEQIESKRVLVSGNDKSRLATYTAWFDRLLDVLPGRDASVLRLERFATWGSAYRRTTKENALSIDEELLWRLGVRKFQLRLFAQQRAHAYCAHRQCLPRQIAQAKATKMPEDLVFSVLCSVATKLSLRSTEQCQSTEDYQAWFTTYDDGGLQHEDHKEHLATMNAYYESRVDSLSLECGFLLIIAAIVTFCLIVSYFSLWASARLAR